MPTRASDEGLPTHYSAIVKIADDSALEELKEAGAIILRQRDNLVLCFIPYAADIEEISDDIDKHDIRLSRRLRKSPRTDGILKIERGRRVTPAMDIARTYMQADNIHSGKDLPQPYTGHGIVVGLTDIGFDPMHINFRDSDGELRIKRITAYSENYAERVVMDTEQEMREWETDNIHENHATHVAGIMAGSYKANGYYGMAPDASIVCSTSELSDAGLLAGAEDILEYAKQQGRPAVINMSMGSYTGPHDGTSLFSQYLDKIGQEAIVVLSAGNNAVYTNTLECDFTDTRKTVQYALHNYRWTQFDMYGITDMWSADDTPFQVQIGVYDEVDNCDKYMSDWIDLTKQEYYLLDSYDPECAEFAKYFEGEFGVWGEFNEENGRFRVSVEYNAHTDEVSTKGKWARYLLTIRVKSDPGTHLYVYTDGQTTRLKGITGNPSPGSSQSISDLACGHNIVSVGMSINRNEVPTVDGSTRTFTSDTPGTVHKASSYGTIIDGRRLPLTVAPGGNIVSSWSGPFLRNTPGDIDIMCAKVEQDGQEHYWGNNLGTSMSAPYVAGSLATWLEANQALSIADIQHIIAATNTTDVADPDNPRHGQGWFKPYEGLKMALQMAGPITQVQEEKQMATLTFDNGVVTYRNLADTPADIAVHDMSGRLVKEQAGVADNDRLDLNTLPSGIYIVTARPRHGEPTRLKLSL